MRLYIAPERSGPRLYLNAPGVSKSVPLLLKKSEGGEGSRGGNVVGHTTTGKPIYESAKTKGSPTVRVATRDGGDDVKVTSHHGDYAVHPSESKFRGHYTVTHKPSGLNVATAFSKDKAQVVASHLHREAGGIDDGFGTIKKENHLKLLDAKKELHNYVFGDPTAKKSVPLYLDMSTKSASLYLDVDKANPHRDPSVGQFIAGGGGAAKGAGQKDLSKEVDDMMQENTK
jgi:hypothetical protein